MPFDTDILWPQRYTEIMAGMIMRAAFGTSTVIDGLTVAQQASPNMSVQVGQGAILTQTVIDPTGVALGSLPADTTTNLVKIGINTQPTNMSALVAPPVSGQSQNWLVQAQFLEQDTNPTALPYYNAANPSVPYTGPANSGTAQNTLRANTVQLQWKGGVAATTGQQNTPTPDAGWVGVAIVTVANGQSTITNSSITPYSSAPYVPTKLAAMRQKLNANLNLYVSSTGSDTSNSGLSAASPFATPQKAWNFLQQGFDLNGFTATISVGGGTYTGGVNASGTVVGQTGAGSILFSGSSATISVSNGACFQAASGAAYTIQGFTLTATGTSGSAGVGLYVSSGSIVQVGASMVFAGFGNASVYANGSCVVQLTASYTVSGGQNQHLLAGSLGVIGVNSGITITLTNSAAANPFCNAALASVINIPSTITFVGTSTGTRYTASGNSVINTSGGATTFLPGSSVGTTASGGQYL